MSGALSLCLHVEVDETDVDARGSVMAAMAAARCVSAP